MKITWKPIYENTYTPRKLINCISRHIQMITRAYTDTHFEFRSLCWCTITSISHRWYVNLQAFWIQGNSVQQTLPWSHQWTNHLTIRTFSRTKSSEIQLYRKVKGKGGSPEHLPRTMALLSAAGDNTARAEWQQLTALVARDRGAMWGSIEHWLQNYYYLWLITS